MNDTLEQALTAKQASREYLLKHFAGMDGEQWHFKPFAECKSPFETLQHLVIDDLSAIESLKTGSEPDYESYKPLVGSVDDLLGALKASHEQLLAVIANRYPNPEEGTPICIWGTQYPFRSGVAWLSSEDCYHAGQIAYIRMANDPSWDYYQAIYGMSFTDVIGSEHQRINP
ncbi:MAG: DinB family protein [Armatimonadetes bacterium]|nr:DinB family protein [Armatimonadota bacterium]